MVFKRIGLGMKILSLMKMKLDDEGYGIVFMRIGFD